MKNLAHSASLDSHDKDAPSKPGIKHLENVSLVHDYVAFPVRTQKASLIAYTEFNYLTASQRKHIMRIREALEVIMQDCLTEGCAKGEFRIKDIAVVRMAIIALCRSVLDWYSPRGRLTPQEIGEYYADLATAIVKPSA